MGTFDMQMPGKDGIKSGEASQSQRASKNAADPADFFK